MAPMALFIFFFQKVMISLEALLVFDN